MKEGLDFQPLLHPAPHFPGSIYMRGSTPIWLRIYNASRNRNVRCALRLPLYAWCAYSNGPQPHTSPSGAGATNRERARAAVLSRLQYRLAKGAVLAALVMPP